TEGGDLVDRLPGSAGVAGEGTRLREEGEAPRQKGERIGLPEPRCGLAEKARRRQHRAPRQSTPPEQRCPQRSRIGITAGEGLVVPALGLGGRFSQAAYVDQSQAVSGEELRLNERERHERKLLGDPERGL